MPAVAVPSPLSLPSRRMNAARTPLLWSVMCLALSASPQSSLPNALDSLDDADVVCLELVQANGDEDGGGVETPDEEPADARHALLWHVVNHDCLEAYVRVHQDGGAEDGVESRARRTGRERR